MVCSSCFKDRSSFIADCIFLLKLELAGARNLSNCFCNWKPVRLKGISWDRYSDMYVVVVA